MLSFRAIGSPPGGRFAMRARMPPDDPGSCSRIDWLNPMGERGIFNPEMTHNAHIARPGYPFPLDAIVLAGTDDNPRRMIKGQNKAFLEIGAKPLVRRVAEALLESDSVGRIFIVGPLERLQAVLPVGARRQRGADARPHRARLAVAPSRPSPGRCLTRPPRSNR